LNKNRDKQQNTKQTEDEARKVAERTLTKEYELRKAIKKIYDQPEGKLFVKWVLDITNILIEPFDNSGRTAYRLGGQKISRILLQKLLASGCDIKLNDLIGNLNITSLSDIEEQLNKLKQEERNARSNTR
jgi:hypothetical protein